LYSLVIAHIGNKLLGIFVESFANAKLAVVFDGVAGVGVATPLNS